MAKSNATTPKTNINSKTSIQKHGKVDQINWLGFSKEKNRTVCSASFIWGNNHHFHRAIRP